MNPNIISSKQKAAKEALGSQNYKAGNSGTMYWQMNLIWCFLVAKFWRFYTDLKICRFQKWHRRKIDYSTFFIRCRRKNTKNFTITYALHISVYHNTSSSLKTYLKKIECWFFTSKYLFTYCCAINPKPTFQNNVQANLIYCLIKLKLVVHPRTLRHAQVVAEVNLAKVHTLSSPRFSRQNHYLVHQPSHIIIIKRTSLPFRRGVGPIIIFFERETRAHLKAQTEYISGSLWKWGPC